ncbi:MAG: DUF2490 domain-containing protein [Cytophagaceae bacterium]|nr:DUF2490 domain-containing protein [Cytophagaceae bacterium]
MPTRTLARCAFFCLLAYTSFGQSNRVRDFNRIGWYVYNGDHKVSPRTEIHTEYQWRREDFIRTWQQSLARLGVAYQLLPRVKVATGFTSLVTHPYGDYPTAETGIPFPERRLYQDLQVSDTLGKVALEHRFRLEQRWIGQLSGREVTDWEYQNRIRYQATLNLPLQGRTLENHEWYLTVFDELFIGFGRNVGNNVFNQNRISGGIGRQFKDNFKIELAYLYQISQHPEPEPLSGKSVFEYNHGFRLNLVYDLDFTK